MILNTGMRTDIPAFYSRWLCSRLKEGFVCVRNPYNSQQVTRYDLSPEKVDLIAFCTKNPGPMLPHMALLEPYGQYWFVTITPYGRDIEPHVPSKGQVADAFLALAGQLGPECMGWRYDPILLTERYDAEYHLRAFEQLAARLEGATRSCVISFVDLYDKVKRNFPEARPVSREDRLLLGSELVKIAGKHGMVLRPCGEGEELAPFGADCRGCMTLELYEKALGCKLNAPRIAPQRKECACLLGTDIGQYDTCGHLCRYCYANSSAQAVRQNMGRHDPSSPLLVGYLRPEDHVHQARQEKWADLQLSLFE